MRSARGSCWMAPSRRHRCFSASNGADFVVHSMTKYLNGHADALAGVVIGKGDEAHTLIPLVRTLGPNLAANEAYMVLRGLKTLTLRLRRQMLNAKLIARALERDPRIARVVHPGLPHIHNMRRRGGSSSRAGRAAWWPLNWRRRRRRT